MEWINKLYTKIYDRNDKLYNEFTDCNLVVSQGKEIIRDCIVKINELKKMPDDYVAWWRLEDNTDNSTVVEEKGNHNGTYVTWTGLGSAYNEDDTDTGSTSGKYDKCLNYDGMQSVIIPYDTALKPAQFTLSLWVKFNTLDTSTNIAGMFGARGTQPAYNGYDLFVGTDGKFTAQTGQWLQATNCIGTTSPVVGAWYNVCMTVDGSDIRLYVNNSLENTTSIVYFFHNTDDLLIGASQMYLYDTASDALIDEVVFYDRVLTDDERTNVHNSRYAIVKGLRNIVLSTNPTAPTSGDTTLGTGSEYNVGRQSNVNDFNLEPDMEFITTTLTGDTLRVKFRWNNTLGLITTLYKLGLYDYNDGIGRLFSALILNGGHGAVVPIGGYIEAQYDLQLTKGGITNGYLTDWGISAVIKTLVYDNNDIYINKIALGTGTANPEIMNGQFAIVEATSVDSIDTDKIDMAFTVTVGSTDCKEIGVCEDAGTVFSKFDHDETNTTFAHTVRRITDF